MGARQDHPRRPRAAAGAGLQRLSADPSTQEEGQQAKRSSKARALLTPFTDDVSLTPGDQRAYAGYVRAQRHKGFQHVVTRFKPRGPREP
ncbi:hypothetical protein GCM10027270_18690 [Nocardioides ginkgobilobae]